MSQSKSYYLSIIIPVYNSSRYLNDLFESLDKQDRKECVQIIFVNDGSTDSSLELILAYQSSTNYFVEVYTQINKGHAAARNEGLSHAKGKYVWFVDSDDILQKEIIGKIIELNNMHDLDMLTINIKYFDYTHSYSELESKMKALQKNTIRKKVKSHICCSGPRIIKRDLLIKNGIVWKDGVTCDDIIFLTEIEMFGDKFAYYDKAYYYIRNTPNSASRVKNDAQKYKIYQSSKIMVEQYLSLRKQNLPDKKRNILDKKIRLACQSLLLRAVVMGRGIDETIGYLQDRKLYPYRIIWSNLLYKSCWKNTILNWSLLLFPNETYYRFAAKVFKNIYKNL